LSASEFERKGRLENNSSVAEVARLPALEYFLAFGNERTAFSDRWPLKADRYKAGTLASSATT
jgi:hypothetical protein